MPAILLTRPREASERLAEELRQYGYDSVTEPLLTIIPAAAPRPGLAGIKAVMITSAHALDALPHKSGDLLALPCFCVGPRTAARARAAGFGQVRSAASDGAQLARLIAHETPQGKILHIAGRDAERKAQDELQRLGFDVVPWTVYAAEPAARFSEPAIAAFAQNRLDAVLVFSARTAETLAALLARHGLEACCARLAAIGLSAAVADVLEPLPWKLLTHATDPTEDAVIARLKEILPIA